MATATTIEVWIWGTRIGFLGYAPGQTETATFEYDEAFARSGIQVSPLLMQYPPMIHTFPDISHRTFHGLPGMIADSLPDKFGNRLIDQYMASKKVAEVTTLDRLAYIGPRGMGALEYKPAEQDGISMDGGALDLHRLSELADMLLKSKEEFADKLSGASSKNEMLGIIRIGSSAGGARAKALVATDAAGSFYDGTVDHGPELKYWLLKFDVGSNSEHGHKDPKGMTRVEYLYSQMAGECGIDISRTDYIEDGDDFHFMIERFDRIVVDGKLERLHYVSWAGAKHYDRDATGAYSYEQLAMAIREMKLGQAALTELFRRAVFNVVGRNQDDHTKNFGFLMDKRGEWRLSPAFDMTYSYDPAGKWTRSHQISLNGKRDGFTRDDLLAFGKFCNLDYNTAEEIIEKTVEVFSGFAERAEEIGVTSVLLTTIENNLRYGTL